MTLIPIVLDKKESILREANLYKIWYTNADCLTNKMKELQALKNNEQVDAFAITEVLPKHSHFQVQEEELQIKGYNSISNFEEAYKHNGRGIILYVKEGIICIRNDKIVKFHENLIVDVSIATGKEISIGIFYRSPNSSNENNTQLLHCMTDLVNKTGLKTVIMGDFNLPRINWSTISAPISSFEDCFLDNISDNFLTQHIKENTRMRSGTVGSILDLIFTKEEEYVFGLEFGRHLGKSDHIVLKVTLDEPTVNTGNNVREKFQHNKGDYAGMIEKLKEVEWEEIFVGKQVEDCWILLKNRLLDLQDEFIPMVTVRQNQKPQWINKTVAMAIKSKKRCWNKYLFCRSEENFEKYQAQRNKLKTEIRKAKRELEVKIASEVKEKPKAFWNYVGNKTRAANQLCQVKKKKVYLHSQMRIQLLV